MGLSSFRVELLRAEFLPLHLLSGFLESPIDDELVRNAARAHHSHLTEHLEFLRGIDFLRKQEELKAWDRRSARDWSQQDSDEVFRVAWQVERYGETYGLLNDSFFSLVALGFFSSGAAREDVLSFLDGQSWATKHEVLTRWGWMGEQRRLLEAGAQLTNPYFCTVAHRLEDGRTTDKEFYNLLLFLHWLRFETSQELLFFSKQQTPDFVLEDECGERIGVEITETSISNEWDSEQDAEREVVRALVSHLGSHFVTPRLFNPPSWREVRNRLPDFESWLSSEVARIAPVLEGPIVLTNHDLGMKIDLIPSDERLQYCIFRGVGPRGMQRPQEVCETLSRRIEKKVRKLDGSPKKLPSVRPCHLVIYPNYDLSADVDAVVTEFLRHPSMDVSSHFDHVWITGEGYLARLI